MNAKKRSNIIISLIILLIISATFTIIYLKKEVNPEDATLECIAEKSVLYVSKTCTHCAEQKLILGDGLKYFELVDCISDTQRCINDGIIVDGKYTVPTWIIDGKTYNGRYTINELKEITGCE